MKNSLIIFITLGFLISNDRQNNLEKHIQCPCDKGLLINHGSSSAMKIKNLISVLIKDSIEMNVVKDFIRETNFVGDDKNTKNDENLDHQMCLITSTEKSISNNKILDSDIYNIIGECYGQHLIKKDKNNSLIYIILFIIITIGGFLSFTFIIRNKKRRL